MSRLKVFERTIKSLENDFIKRSTNTISEEEEVVIGINLVLEYHKDLHNELNELKKSLGIEESTYINPYK